MDSLAVKTPSAAVVRRRLRARSFSPHIDRLGCLGYSGSEQTKKRRASHALLIASVPQARIGSPSSPGCWGLHKLSAPALAPRSTLLRQSTANGLHLPKPSLPPRLLNSPAPSVRPRSSPSLYNSDTASLATQARPQGTRTSFWPVPEDPDADSL